MSGAPSSGLAAFRLQFNVSPIIMTGGIASGAIGGALPALAISSALSFAQGLLNAGSTALGLDDYFAFFQPMPGGTLIDQQIGMYPFANQSVAANATIQEPINISMMMICPAGRGGGYSSRLSQMTAIQQAFDQHNKSGGLYSIMTPSFVYTNCVMTSMTDMSTSSTKQVQNIYKLDFLKPLVTLSDAANAQNALMSKISDGLPTDGSQFNPNTVVGSTVGSTAPTALLAGGQGGLIAAPGGPGTAR